METNHRSFLPKQVCYPHQLQDGDGFIGVGDVMFLIDLKDTYFQVPIHRNCHEWRRLSVSCVLCNVAQEFLN